jgi:polyisoprenoid-binding protein YceI
MNCVKLALSALLLASNLGAADAPSWRVERGATQVLVPLRPGGAFSATTSSLCGTLTLEPGKPARLTGELSIDLTTIDTGIALRNQHLREKYLEVGKGKGFDKALLSDIQLADADGAAFQGRTPFAAKLLLHGVKHPVAGTVEIRPEGQGRRVRAEFPLQLSDFNVAPPLYLGVGVANRLLVKVQLTATPAPANP